MGFKSKNLAFTLAEVLITLGVIWVVAAMTLPAVVGKYKEQVTVNKVKKIYSTMSNAILSSINDNGYPYEWNVSDKYTQQSANEFAGYIIPYLKIIKNCGVNSGCIGYRENVKKLNGVQHSANYDINKNYYKIILSDGSIVWFRGPENKYCIDDEICGLIMFDINGNNSPNTFGKDIFELIVSKRGISKHIENDCYMDKAGWSCSDFILSNGNMNYPQTANE